MLHEPISDMPERSGTMRNRRRGENPWAPVRRWFHIHREALTILGCMFLAGLIIGSLTTVSWQRHRQSGVSTDELLFPEEPTTITVDQAPKVVSCFKYWTETPGGNTLLMVWSDGQVWSAPTETPATLAEWTLFSHVRLGGTP